MMNIDPLTLADRYPSYGLKSRYQIKSLVSIVNMDYPVHLISNIFNKNAGTKGVVYLDMNHQDSVERALIVGNTFTYNAGFLDSSAIFVRARGKPAADVYSVLPASTDA